MALSHDAVQKHLDDCERCQAYARRMFAATGGRAVAEEKGPEYFRKLQARRRHRKGGRPKKKNNGKPK